MFNRTSGGVANTDGCALSYLSHYVGRFDLTAATDIWDQYKNHFLTTTVIGTGFREYPIDISASGHLTLARLCCGSVLPPQVLA